MKPNEAIGKPSLIIFSDGSDHAYGSVAYVRWHLRSGGFESRLIMAKSRVAPLKKINIVKIELCGSLLSARVRTTIEKS